MQPRHVGDENRKAAGGNRTASKDSKNDLIRTDANAQRHRLIVRLRIGPVTTIYARRVLDIMMPAARIRELRLRGYVIITQWQMEATDSGILHRVARYVLMKEPLS